MKTTNDTITGDARIRDEAQDATTASAARAALPYVKAPPTISIPPVPVGIVTVPPAQLRAQLPRKEELELMPDVESEMARFDDYAEVFGKTAPSRAVVEQSLSSAHEWSHLRMQLSAWERYAQSQEAMAWVSARGFIRRLSPAFALAVETDVAIEVSYPSLGRLFGVRASIAKRAAAVRIANADEKAAGRPAYKGEAGKRRRRADERAALAARE